MASKKKEKIIIVGLDNAGKSTILLTLNKKTKFQDYGYLQPTKGVVTEEIETQESVISVWDFGGQELYRERYFERPTYFAETDKVIFVIDIQDDARFEIALEYFEEILKILKDYEGECEVSVFFHKFDPELIESKEFQDKSQALRKKLRNLLQKYPFSLSIFHTSIYTVFQRIQVM